jgi:hypothetical protein
MEGNIGRWNDACLENGIEFHSIVPDEVQDGWKLLGYDVSDLWLMSSLKNIENSTLSGKRLDILTNDYRLFSRLEDANGFVRVSEKCCRSHAPFFPFGIWVVPDN